MRQTLISVAALLSGAAVLTLGGGLQSILVPLRAEAEGFPTLVLGLLGTTYSIGFVVGCIVIPVIVRRVGHIRTFGVLCALAAAAVLAKSLAIDAYAWIALRLVTGFAFAGTAMVIESWLNAAAENRNRGTIFSFYMVINLAAVTVGQLSIALGDPATGELFAVVAIFIVLSLIPTALSTRAGPPAPESTKVRLLTLYRISPVGAVGVFLVGLANGAFGTLGAIYARSLGLPVEQIAWFMSAAVVGGAVLQWPIGKLSDRIDRRRIVIGVALGAAVAGLAIGLAGSRGPVLPIGGLVGLVAVFGGFVYTLYGLLAAHANDYAAPQAFVETSAGLLLLFGLGAILGPVFAALAMAEYGSWTLFLFTAGMHGLLIVFTAWRMTRRAPPPAEEKTGFVVMAKELTQEALQLDPRSTEAAAETSAAATAPPTGAAPADAAPAGADEEPEDASRPA